MSNISNSNGHVCNPGSAEDAAVAFDFRLAVPWPLIVVRKLDGGAAIYFAELANQADGIEAFVAARIAIAEIVGEIRAPAGAEAYTRIQAPTCRHRENRQRWWKSAGVAPLRSVPPK